ncbi:AcrR family transcriptional regulator [Paraburkholderia bannensis]|uniref:AcrR family transcriptional regulator n=1 Tax=Paraburkholderia bannensis TaxID=765414 RepID=A0A7W9TYE7_9BURK|nr:MULTISPECIES: TetR/AcrR family transcriptional regulator [Paraburkholderia]MBB3258682.1 AcrR family transcriptional regulator [Paraburkholderia sp. WP4_3_2]MBB6103696.1 AcrR family transcriptional regulator [Paraburkholderia bannensis]
MKPERLSHARRKEQTRERLYGAARTMFLGKGFAATSVEDIVEAAGYTRGAFYSNFRSKQELLTELLRRDAEAAQADLRAIFEEAGTPGQATARVIANVVRSWPERECFALWVEAYLLARHDTAFQERIHALRRENLSHVGAHIQTLFTQNDNALPLRAEALALGFVSLCEGMQLLGLCNSQSASDQTNQTVLAEFASSVLCQQPIEKTPPMHVGRVPPGAESPSETATYCDSNMS